MVAETKETPQVVDLESLKANLPMAKRALVALALEVHSDVYDDVAARLSPYLSEEMIELALIGQRLKTLVQSPTFLKELELFIVHTANRHFPGQMFVGERL